MKTITWEEFEEIQDGGAWPGEWEAVTEEEPVGQSRWHIQYEQVFKSADERFFRFYWRVGATENQDNDEDIYMVEVEPYEVTVTEYRAKK